MQYEELYDSLCLLGLTDSVSDELAALPEALRDLHVAAILDMEILNGGLCQFFCNCGLPYAARVAGSLRRIGLAPMADLYEQFLDAQGIKPDDLRAMHVDTVEQFAALYDAYPYDAFDSAYMALREQLDFEGAMIRFAAMHPEALAQR